MQAQPPRPARFIFVRRELRPLRLDVHPVAAALAGLGVLLLIGWSAATTSYAVFHDEVLMRLADRHAAAQHASRAEIVRLKAEIERMSSRHLVERVAMDSKLDDLAKRQAAVERRQEILTTLSGSAPETAPAATPDAAPEPAVMPLRQSQAFPEISDSDGSRAAALTEAYDRIDRTQTAALASLERRYENERSALNDVYRDLGLNFLMKNPVQASVGGPFIPTTLGSHEHERSGRLGEIAEETARLRSGLDLLPVRMPLEGPAEQVSGFGTRSDPFLGTPAFHSGIDLKAASGTPAYATAGGTVVSAGWNGGYGLMVEVRHACGYTTRYGHLSQVTVREGQEIAAGDIVGRVGSTGRSTGAHLHYEVRVADQAINPGRFLAAATVLAQLD